MNKQQRVKRNPICDMCGYSEYPIVKRSRETASEGHVDLKTKKAYSTTYEITVRICSECARQEALEEAKTSLQAHGWSEREKGHYIHPKRRGDGLYVYEWEGKVGQFSHFIARPKPRWTMRALRNLEEYLNNLHN